ncbi:MAG: hypothetical protein P8Y45_01230 [Exilibacterium sp.]
MLLDQLRATGVMFPLYTLLLEQTLNSPVGPFRRGVLMDYLVSRFPDPGMGGGARWQYTQSV